MHIKNFKIGDFIEYVNTDESYYYYNHIKKKKFKLLGFDEYSNYHIVEVSGLGDEETYQKYKFNLNEDSKINKCWEYWSIDSYTKYYTDLKIDGSGKYKESWYHIDDYYRGSFRGSRMYLKDESYKSKPLKNYKEAYKLCNS